MMRTVLPELLDQLPASDPRAIGSRRDLQRVNSCMGQAALIARALAAHFSDRPPHSIVDLGGGDGTLLLRVARRLAPRWKSLRAVLVDRRKILSRQTAAQFEALGWHVESFEGDVFEWLEGTRADRSDAIIANLFLHHFRQDDLRRLLKVAAQKTDFFLACEPRRDSFSLLSASLLGFIGCNAVTRHDAKVSVQAGFLRNELSELWPGGDQWQLQERPAGLFSHCFVAHRIAQDAAV